MGIGDAGGGAPRRRGVSGRLGLCATPPPWVAAVAGAAPRPACPSCSLSPDGGGTGPGRQL